MNTLRVSNSSSCNVSGGSASPGIVAATPQPDDIEWTMAGTLLLLKRAESEIHMWNLANGSCGAVRHSDDENIRLRTQRKRASRLA